LSLPKFSRHFFCSPPCDSSAFAFLFPMKALLVVSTFRSICASFSCYQSFFSVNSLFQDDEDGVIIHFQQQPLISATLLVTPFPSFLFALLLSIFPLDRGAAHPGRKVRISVFFLILFLSSSKFALPRLFSIPPGRAEGQQTRKSRFLPRLDEFFCRNHLIPSPILPAA